VAVRVGGQRRPPRRQIVIAAGDFDGAYKPLSLPGGASHAPDSLYCVPQLLEPPRDAPPPSPGRFLGRRRAVPAAVRQSAPRTAGRRRPVRAAARGGAGPP